MNLESYYTHIVDDLFQNLGSDDVKYILKQEDKETFKARSHIFFGMHVRNTYSLWKEENPLTRQWFEDNRNGTNEHIINDVDHHPNHPDAVSSEIIGRLWEKVHNG